MFSKKAQKPQPQQIYEQQYSQAESEPLIQQVDPNYQPTQKQVKQYAIETLGMKFPQDANLLYLARQGLKAPIPTNWVPYQSRDGEIYYKHKITQQKIYDHPTDIQYKKKYQQMKQKAARKNLKSISLKQNMGMQGLLPNNNSLAAGLGLLNNSAFPGAGISNLSNLSGVSGMSMGQQFTQPTIDQQVIAEYEKQLSQYEKKQQKIWKQWQIETEQQHKVKIKKIKQQHQQQKKFLSQGSNLSKKSQSKHISQQQSKLQKSLQQSQQNSLNQQLRLKQKQQQNKLQQYKAVYEQDNNIKLHKLQQQLQQNYQQKSKILQQKLKKIQQKRIQQKQNRNKILKQTKQQLQKPDNPQILALLKSTLDDNLKGIKQQYSKKIKQRQQQIQQQLHEMKKILGVDKNQNLLLLASKKQKLLTLSNMKITSKRNKQIQIIQNQAQKQLQYEMSKLKQKINKDLQQKLQQKKKQLEQIYKIKKNQIQNQYIEKTTKSIEQLYQNMTLQKNNYESTMNKKMSQLRMKYINKLSDIGDKKKEGKQQMIINRVILQQKQTQVTNKQQLIKGLQRQLDMQRRQWKVMQFEQQMNKLISSGNGDENQLTSHLKYKIKSMNLNYKSSQFTKYIQKFQSLQKQYKQDKKLLTRVLKALQSTSAYNLYEMKNKPYSSNNESQITSMGTGAMIKKYNQDVRKMRQNQDMLNKYQSLIKRVQMGGNNHEENMQNLRNFIKDQLQYKQIQLKEQIQKFGSKYMQYGSQKQINQLSNIKQTNQYSEKNNQKQLQANPLSKDNKYKTSYPFISSSNYNASSTSVQQTLRQHSRFLSNVKNQLNRKLYQVRYQTKY